jgi:hypothetical protein
MRGLKGVRRAGWEIVRKTCHTKQALSATPGLPGGCGQAPIRIVEGCRDYRDRRMRIAAWAIGRQIVQADSFWPNRSSAIGGDQI